MAGQDKVQVQATTVTLLQFSKLCLVLKFLSLETAFRIQSHQYLMSRHYKPRAEGQIGDSQLIKRYVASPALHVLRL